MLSKARLSSLALTLDFGSFAFNFPKLHCNGTLTTELGYIAVDCHSSHNGNNTVSLLASVHVEQHLNVLRII